MGPSLLFYSLSLFLKIYFGGGGLCIYCLFCVPYCAPYCAPYCGNNASSLSNSNNNSYALFIISSLTVPHPGDTPTGVPSDPRLVRLGVSATVGLSAATRLTARLGLSAATAGRLNFANALTTFSFASSKLILSDDIFFYVVRYYPPKSPTTKNFPRLFPAGVIPPHVIFNHSLSP